MRERRNGKSCEIWVSMLSVRQLERQEGVHRLAIKRAVAHQQTVGGRLGWHCRRTNEPHQQIEICVEKPNAFCVHFVVAPLYCHCSCHCVHVHVYIEWYLSPFCLCQKGFSIGSTLIVDSSFILPH